MTQTRRARKVHLTNANPAFVNAGECGTVLWSAGRKTNDRPQVTCERCRAMIRRALLEAVRGQQDQTAARELLNLNAAWRDADAVTHP